MRLPNRRTRQRHYIDRRADQVIADSTGSGDDLLKTPEVAAWLGVSIQWVEIGRSRGWGPKYTKLSRRMVRYKRSDVLTWLKERTYSNTSEYA